MCGIAGINLSEHDIRNNYIDVQKLATELLLEIEARGTDATGAAYFDGDTLLVHKDAMRATWFVEWLDLPPTTRNIILHTRFGTKGSEHINYNNHPIVSGNIVGVHNGCVSNDDSLFKTMGIEHLRVGQVDSEAIFAAINFGTQLDPNGDPLLAPKLSDVLETIRGSAAIAWQEIDGNPHEMRVARINQSPFYWGRTPGGSFIFASEKHHLERACKAAGVELNFVTPLSEGDYMLITSGDVTKRGKFTPYRPTYGTLGSTSSTTYLSGPQGAAQPSTKSTSTMVGSPTTSVSQAGQLALPMRTNVKETVKLQKEAIPHHKPNDNGVLYLSPPAIHHHVATTFSTELIPEMSVDEFRGKYSSRWSAIRAAHSECPTEQMGDDKCSELGADIYPGQVVQLRFKGEPVFGQVWLVPSTFPEGSYIIRALIPNESYKGGYEPVLVERAYHEFGGI